MAGVHGAIVFLLGVAAVVEYAGAGIVSICTANIEIKFKVIAEVVANADGETGMTANICSRTAFKCDGL